METGNVILLVEDNPGDVQLTLRALKRHRLENDVIIAADGQAALGHLFGAAGQEPGPPPILVLLDIGLPKINGLRVLELMRADPRTRHIPVIVLSATEDEEEAIRSRRLGAIAMLHKPLDFAAFSLHVQRLGLTWTSLAPY